MRPLPSHVVEVGWAHACQSRVTVPCRISKPRPHVNHMSQCPRRISKPHPHLATCLLPRLGFQGPLSAESSQGHRQVSSWGEGGRDGRFRVPPAPSIWSVLMATLAGEAPWLPLHKTLEMTLGQPCCCPSSPISPRHGIVSPPLGIRRTHLIRIASAARFSEPAPGHKDILPPHPPPKLPTGSLCRKGSKLPSRSDVLLGPRLPRQDRLPWRVDQILISAN